MKSAFTFNGKHYLSPTKIEAILFLRHFGDRPGKIYRFRTEWHIKHIERSPSYAQMMKVSLDKVEFADI